MKIGFFDDFQLGVVKGENIVDLGPLLEDIHVHEPQELIAGIIESWDENKEMIAEFVAANEGVPLTSVRIRPPLPRPDKIICMAVNYLEGENPPMPQTDAFLKSSDCVVGNGDTVFLDPECNPTIFHCEAEVAVVIGKPGKGVKQADAMDYVFGYTGFMDVSARIAVRGSQSYFQAKSWATFGPMGPFIVTKDDISDPQDINVRIRNNDYDFPGYNTKDMAHKVPECIEFASAIMPLNPGDLISTGTNHQNLGSMQNGDHYSMDIDKIGTLNVVVEDPLGREWARGRDEDMATRMRPGEKKE
ncbi:MAG: fumarylacetoacetate hydrolase family protein [Chloroflexi bacterium]|nr:fumarylacetoacetate hydrolase family protein [Chloroflexota bacterium]